MQIIARIITQLSVLLFCGGCLSLLAGCQMTELLRGVGSTMNQRNQFGWDSEGNVTAVTVGSHEAGWEMAEGELAIKDDGNGGTVLDPDNSYVNSWLKVYPKADEVAGASTHAMVIGAEAQRDMLATIQGLTATIVGAVIPGNGGDLAITAKLDAILEQLGGLEHRLEAVEQPPAPVVPPVPELPP